MQSQRNDGTVRPQTATVELVAAAAIDAASGFVHEFQEGGNRTQISRIGIWRPMSFGAAPYGERSAATRRSTAIHTLLKRAGVGGASSRVDIVSVVPVAAEVVVAQVRRPALDSVGNAVDPSGNGEAGVSEVALRVPVRRNGAWWVAAGQTTPIQPASTPSG
jgi:hypothetical protein